MFLCSAGGKKCVCESHTCREELRDSAGAGRRSRCGYITPPKAPPRLVCCFLCSSERGFSQSHAYGEAMFLAAAEMRGFFPPGRRERRATRAEKLANTSCLPLHPRQWKTPPDRAHPVPILPVFTEESTGHVPNNVPACVVLSAYPSLFPS